MIGAELAAIAGEGLAVEPARVEFTTPRARWWCNFEVEHGDAPITIPPCDLYFRECAFIDPLSGCSYPPDIEHLLRVVVSNNRPVTKSQLWQMAKSGTGLVLGDVYVGESERELIRREKLELVGGAIALIGARIPWRESRRNQGIDRLKTRRSFLKALAVLTATAGLWGTFPEITRDIERWLRDGGNENQAKHLSRFKSFGGHLHPEDPNIFLRDALIALKLMAAAEINKPKPIIGLSLGQAHRGVADLLRLNSPEFCRWLLTTFYHGSSYRQLALRNGGPKLDIETGINTIVSAKIIYPQPELTVGDIIQGNPDKFWEQHIFDRELLNYIKEKLVLE